MNRVRQSSAGSAQEMRPVDQQQTPKPSAFPPPVDHQQQVQPWLQQQQQLLQERHQRSHHPQQLQDQHYQQQLQEQHQQRLLDQQQYRQQPRDQYHQQSHDQQQHQQYNQQPHDQRQYHQQRHDQQYHQQPRDLQYDQRQYHHDQQRLQQNQQRQLSKLSLPNESFIPEAQSQLRNMPPDGSSTRSSLQENTPPSGVDKDASSPDLTDSSSQLSSEESEERRETSSLSYGSLPRPNRHHYPTAISRGYMQQSSYPHSLPPTASYTSYTTGRMDNIHHGFMHSGGHHAPSSVVSTPSNLQQHHPGHPPAHMYNHHIMDRQLVERQQMDRLQAMERQKQIERQLPMSRPNPLEQLQYNQPPPVPTGTQRPQPLYPRGSQDWSPNVNRQRNLSYQDDDLILKKRQVEAQQRLMQQESSRRVHMMMPHQHGGVYHADSLQHLPMTNDGSWNRHPINYHDHMSPYLHQSGGRHSYSAGPTGRDILGPSSMYPHHQQGQRHRTPHHTSSQQPPPQGHEQSDKNFSVIQV